MINSRGWLFVFLATCALIMLAGKARATDAPCPPQRFYCWQIKAAAELFGETYLEAKARACKWPERKIEAARRCLSSVKREPS